MHHFYWKKHTFNFKAPSGTSRGVLHQKDSWFLIKSVEGASYPGLGECNIIEGLSPDPTGRYEALLDTLCQALNHDDETPDLSQFPSIAFGLETLQMDLASRGSKVFFDNSFANGEAGQLINGLIWMGDIASMRDQIQHKVKDGFQCIKLKIGAMDFKEELALLKWTRKEYSEKDLELRVDANGAFQPAEALEKLKWLSDHALHSIEQPIKAGQWDEMAQLCRDTPLPIALDEELIGVSDDEKHNLLQTIKPQYIILKPSLVGGLKASDEWVELAEKMDIGWWVTSALESNIGLNCISQYTAEKHVTMPQGLGTGALFTNNFDSPLYLQSQFIRMHPKHVWNLKPLSL